MSRLRPGFPFFFMAPSGTPSAASSGSKAVFTAGRADGMAAGGGVTTFFDTGNNGDLDAFCGNIMPFAGTIGNLFIETHTTNDQDAGDTVYTLMVNGVATSITVTVQHGDLVIVSDTTHTASVSAGARVTLRAVAGGSAGQQLFDFSYTLTSS